MGFGILTVNMSKATTQIIGQLFVSGLVMSGFIPVAIVGLILAIPLGYFARKSVFIPIMILSIFVSAAASSYFWDMQGTDGGIVGLIALIIGGPILLIIYSISLLVGEKKIGSTVNESTTTTQVRHYPNWLYNLGLITLSAIAIFIVWRFVSGFLGI